MNRNMGTAYSRVRYFSRMNPLEFYGSKVEGDIPEFIYVVYKVLAIKLKDVGQVWYNQCKEGRPVGEGPIE